MTKIKHVHVLYALISMLLFRVNGSEFSQSNFVVWFNPYVSTKDIGFLTRYDINGLIPMIIKISSKFNKIMIGDMERYDRGLSVESISHSLIAPAVATFNKFHLKPLQSPMEVLMTFNITNSLTNVSRTQLGIVKRLADKANRIFPGTVKTLYLDYPYLTDATVEVTKEYLETALNFVNTSFYELGARLPIEDCGRVRLPNYIIPILPYIRKIFFYRLPTSPELVLGAERTFPGFSINFEQCHHNIESINRNISIGFESAWLYSNGIGDIENDVNLFTFWRKMNDWALKNNKTVVLREAFDIVWNSEATRHQGWWKFVQNSRYYHSSHYVFEEKRGNGVTNTTFPQARSIDSISNPVIQMVKLIYFDGFPLVYKLKQVGQYFYFHRTKSSPQIRAHTAVWFDPYVSIEDVGHYERYDEDELLPMISTIWSKFSKIMVKKLDFYNSARSDLLIPSAVAKFNKNLKQKQQLLEVMMVFDLIPEYGYLSTSFNLTKKLADEANAIQPGTVKKLYFDINFLNDEIAEKILRHLVDVQKVVNNTNYELGAHLHISYCGGIGREAHLPTYVLPILSHFQHIIFTHYEVPTQPRDVIDIVSYLTNHFTGCLVKLELREFVKTPEIMFSSGWVFQKGTTLDCNYNNLVEFWEVMADWALKSDVPILFLKAFDSPSDSYVNRQKMGWWRLSSNSSQLKPFQYEFEEKKEETECKLVNDTSPTTTTTIPATTPTLLTTPATIPTTTTTIPTRKTTIPTTTTTLPTTKTTIPTTTTIPRKTTIMPPATPPLPPTNPNVISSPLIPPSVSSSFPPYSTGLDTISIILMALGITLLVFGLSLVTAVIWCKPFRQHSTPMDNTIEEDIKEFYEGANEAIEEQDCIPGLRNMRYNKDLEIPKTSFKIDFKAVLGSGAFGAVYRGSIQTEFEIQVAVKTTKKTSPSTAISGLLSEIKVMSYIGQHLNIVSMIGAFTKEVKTGKIYLFLEFCSLGSLEKYLRRNISAYVNTLEDDQPATSGNRYEDVNARISSPCVSITKRNSIVEWFKTPSPSYMNLPKASDKKLCNGSDLHRWCREIANGMEYLASKHVLHADLATRNVLLSMDRTAKISDFGLSRRLYDYTNYVKKHQEPLPWRWMAPESLRLMEFNEKTDVWSFGVTLWEIFSLGDIPFQGLSWTIDFSSQLLNGLRLPTPKYEDGDMYSRMLLCWNVSPNMRPTFAELKKMLE